MTETELMNEALDYMYELRGEWDWKSNEPRAGNKIEYDRLCEHIDQMERLLMRGDYAGL